MSVRREYTIRLGWFGMRVLVRYRVAVGTPGTWRWSRWERARLDELADVLRRLTAGD